MKRNNGRNKNRLFEETINVNGSAVGDGVLFNLGRQIYLRSIISSAECYWQHDSGLLNFTQVVAVGAFSPENKYPIQTYTTSGTAPSFAFTLGGAGTPKRLYANIERRYYPEPLRIFYLGLWRLAANCAVSFTYYL